MPRPHAKTFHVVEPTGHHHPPGHCTAAPPGGAQKKPPGQGEAVGDALREGAALLETAAEDGWPDAVRVTDAVRDAERAGEEDGAAEQERPANVLGGTSQA